MQYIDAHPELAEQGFADPQRGRRQLLAEEGLVRRARTPSACAVAPAARMTPDELDARRAYRVAYKANAKTWLDTAGADNLGVDAVVYPGLLSDISSTTAAAARRASAAATRRAPVPASRRSSSPRATTTTASRSTCSCSAARGTTTSSSAWPTRSSSCASKDGKGHVAADTAPALPVVTDDRRARSAARCRRRCRCARRPGVLRRVHAGRDEGLHGVDDRDRDLDGRRRGADASPTPAT